LNFDLLWSFHQNGKLLVFDMDDTIYREIDFLYPVYKKIAVEFFEDDWSLPYEFLCSGFKENGRKYLFDDLLDNFPAISEGHNVNRCLEIMRGSVFKESLPVFPWFSRFISAVDKPFQLKIITNGHRDQQKNKFSSLAFNRKGIQSQLICADDYGGKPRSDALTALEGIRKMANVVYVGDSLVDLEFCQNAGIEFFDVNEN
jgi:putative hydrolase of the HAD superfamily